MPCMSGMLRSSTIRSTGSIASRSMASRPLPACVDLTLRSEPNEVITMRLMVGESSTTKILFILRSSDIAVWLEVTLHRADSANSRGCDGKSGERVIGDGNCKGKWGFGKRDIHRLRRFLIDL